jgi:putative transposase
LREGTVRHECAPYDHIRDEADLANHVRYCWINPVKHGLVGHPREWPYSSYHHDGGGDLML